MSERMCGARLSTRGLKTCLERGISKELDKGGEFLVANFLDQSLG